jgi:hypothetical protein
MRSRRDTLAAAVVLTFASSGCARDPAYAFGRLAERAASWGASIEFAQELAAGGLVPRAYLDDLMSTGSRELTGLAHQIEKLEGLDDRAKTTALANCSGLAALAGEAARTRGSLTQSSLRELEQQLRDAAQQARAASGRR